jgi:hypothetical protein
MRNGRDEKKMAERLLLRYSGTQSSQSSVGSIGIERKRL